MSMVGDVRIAKGLLSFQMAGAAERKERETKVSGGWREDKGSAGQRSEENKLVDDNDSAKRDIEESLYLIRLSQPFLIRPITLWYGLSQFACLSIHRSKDWSSLGSLS